MSREVESRICASFSIPPAEIGSILKFSMQRRNSVSPPPGYASSLFDLDAPPGELLLSSQPEAPDGVGDVRPVSPPPQRSVRLLPNRFQPRCSPPPSLSINKPLPPSPHLSRSPTPASDIVRSCVANFPVDVQKLLPPTAHDKQKQSLSGCNSLYSAVHDLMDDGGSHSNTQPVSDTVLSMKQGHPQPDVIVVEDDDDESCDGGGLQSTTAEVELPSVATVGVGVMQPLPSSLQSPIELSFEAVQAASARVEMLVWTIEKNLCARLMDGNKARDEDSSFPADSEGQSPIRGDLGCSAVTEDYLSLIPETAELIANTQLLKNVLLLDLASVHKAHFLMEEESPPQRAFYTFLLHVLDTQATKASDPRREVAAFSKPYRKKHILEKCAATGDGEIQVRACAWVLRDLLTPATQRRQSQVTATVADVGVLSPESATFPSLVDTLDAILSFRRAVTTTGIDAPQRNADHNDPTLLEAKKILPLLEELFSAQLMLLGTLRTLGQVHAAHFKPPPPPPSSSTKYKSANSRSTDDDLLLLLDRNCGDRLEAVGDGHYYPGVETTYAYSSLVSLRDSFCFKIPQCLLVGFQNSSDEIDQIAQDILKRLKRNQCTNGLFVRCIEGHLEYLRRFSTLPPSVGLVSLFTNLLTSGGSTEATTVATGETSTSSSGGCTDLFKWILTDAHQSTETCAFADNEHNSPTTLCSDSKTAALRTVLWYLSVTLTLVAERRLNAFAALHCSSSASSGVPNNISGISSSSPPHLPSLSRLLGRYVASLTTTPVLNEKPFSVFDVVANGLSVNEAIFDDRGAVVDSSVFEARGRVLLSLMVSTEAGYESLSEVFEVLWRDLWVRSPTGGQMPSTHPAPIQGTSKSTSQKGDVRLPPSPSRTPFVDFLSVSSQLLLTPLFRISNFVRSLCVSSYNIVHSPNWILEVLGTLPAQQPTPRANEGEGAATLPALSERLQQSQFSAMFPAGFGIARWEGVLPRVSGEEERDVSISCDTTPANSLVQDLLRWFNGIAHNSSAVTANPFSGENSLHLSRSFVLGDGSFCGASRPLVRGTHVFDWIPPIVTGVPENDEILNECDLRQEVFEAQARVAMILHIATATLQALMGTLGGIAEDGGAERQLQSLRPSPSPPPSEPKPHCATALSPLWGALAIIRVLVESPAILKILSTRPDLATSLGASLKISIGPECRGLEAVRGEADNGATKCPMHPSAVPFLESWGRVNGLSIAPNASSPAPFQTPAPNSAGAIRRLLHCARRVLIPFLIEHGYFPTSATSTTFSFLKEGEFVATMEGVNSRDMWRLLNGGPEGKSAIPTQVTRTPSLISAEFIQYVATPSFIVGLVADIEYLYKVCAPGTLDLHSPHRFLDGLCVAEATGVCMWILDVISGLVYRQVGGLSISANDLQSLTNSSQLNAADGDTARSCGARSKEWRAILENVYPSPPLNHHEGSLRTIVRVAFCRLAMLQLRLAVSYVSPTSFHEHLGGVFVQPALTALMTSLQMSSVAIRSSPIHQIVALTKSAPEGISGYTPGVVTSILRGFVWNRHQALSPRLYDVYMSTVRQVVSEIIGLQWQLVGKFSPDIVGCAQTPLANSTVIDGGDRKLSTPGLPSNTTRGSQHEVGPVERLLHALMRDRWTKVQPEFPRTVCVTSPELIAVQHTHLSTPQPQSLLFLWERFVKRFIKCGGPQGAISDCPHPHASKETEDKRSILVNGMQVIADRNPDGNKAQAPSPSSALSLVPGREVLITIRPTPSRKGCGSEHQGPDGHQILVERLSVGTGSDHSAETVLLESNSGRSPADFKEATLKLLLVDQFYKSPTPPSATSEKSASMQNHPLQRTILGIEDFLLVQVHEVLRRLFAEAAAVPTNDNESHPTSVPHVDDDMLAAVYSLFMANPSDDGASQHPWGNDAVLRSLFGDLSDVEVDDCGGETSLHERRRSNEVRRFIACLEEACSLRLSGKVVQDIALANQHVRSEADASALKGLGSACASACASQLGCEMTRVRHQLYEALLDVCCGIQGRTPSGEVPKGLRGISLSSLCSENGKGKRRGFITSMLSEMVLKQVTRVDIPRALSQFKLVRSDPFQYNSEVEGGPSPLVRLTVEVPAELYLLGRVINHQFNVKVESAIHTLCCSLRGDDDTKPPDALSLVASRFTLDSNASVLNGLRAFAHGLLYCLPSVRSGGVLRLPPTSLSEGGNACVSKSSLGSTDVLQILQYFIRTGRSAASGSVTATSTLYQPPIYLALATLEDMVRGATTGSGGMSYDASILRSELLESLFGCLRVVIPRQPSVTSGTKRNRENVTHAESDNERGGAAAPVKEIATDALICSLKVFIESVTRAYLASITSECPSLLPADNAMFALRREHVYLSLDHGTSRISMPSLQGSNCVSTDPSHISVVETPSLSSIPWEMIDVCIGNSLTRLPSRQHLNKTRAQQEREGWRRESRCDILASGAAPSRSSSGHPPRCSILLKSDTGASIDLFQPKAAKPLLPLDNALMTWIVDKWSSPAFRADAGDRMPPSTMSDHIASETAASLVLCRGHYSLPEKAPHLDEHRQMFVQRGGPSNSTPPILGQVSVYTNLFRDMPASDVYWYCGHGHGTQLLRSSALCELLGVFSEGTQQVSASKGYPLAESRGGEGPFAMLVGCSTLKHSTSSPGGFEQWEAPLSGVGSSILTHGIPRSGSRGGGSPICTAVLGSLWTVLDRQSDAFSISFMSGLNGYGADKATPEEVLSPPALDSNLSFSQWLASARVRALHAPFLTHNLHRRKLRQDTLFPYANGGAFVMYGLADNGEKTPIGFS